MTGLADFVKACPAEHGGRRWFVGATAVDGWTLLIEENGFLGVTPEVIGPLSAGTRVVSHYKNVNAVGSFCWMVDGDLRLQFDPLFAYARSGSDPDGLTDEMVRAGFDLTADDDYDLSAEAAFALAEHLTGVRVTNELLESATYLCGLAPLK